MNSLQCSKCSRWVENVGEDAKKVTCSVCVLMAVGLPEEPKNYTSTGRPPGWHFMAEYVDKDGTVFHKGKEQPKLKGTLKPTKVKPPKKRIKRRTKDAILVEKYNEKKKALKKAVKKQQDFINHNINKG
jgi:hypothetical protein|tara:strand:+ start:100 stop:486 length:387 start_codon:yes stop_codon:yes gene_type:complete